MVQLKDKHNPYIGSPFRVLGVKPGANSRELNQAHIERLDEINDEGLPDDERIKRQQEVKAAYNQVRDAVGRASLDLCTLDTSLGEERCRKEATALRTFRYDYDALFGQTEELLPDRPNIENARAQCRAVELDTALVLQSEGHAFAPDVGSDVLKSITFET